MTDPLQYAKSSKTLKRKTTQIRLEPGNRAGLLEHETVTEPGRFVGGALENWSVSIRAGRALGAEALEIIGSGPTREEAIAKAEAVLRSRAK